MPAERATARAPAQAAGAAPITRRRDTTPSRPATAAGLPVLRLVPPAARREEGLEELLKSPGPGAPLPDATRRRLEKSLRVDLSPVRVHDDARAAAVASRLRARAFTFGRRIFLGRAELVTDEALIAHEAAHVVQQRGRPVVQMATPVPSGSALEREADTASAAVQRGQSAAIVGRTDGPAIQRQERLGTIEAGPAPEQEEESSWSIELLWGKLGAAGAVIRQIVKVGVVRYLRDQIVGAFGGFVDRLLEPVRALLNAMPLVRSEFTKLIGWMREAAGLLAKNDCSPITQAIHRVREIADAVLTVVKEKIEAVWEKVKGFFTGLWDKFGAPIWNLLKEIGGEIWEKIQQLGAWIWEKTQPVRDWLTSAWTWIKNKLGVGEGEEGQNGLMQWVQRKAADAWAEIKPVIEPYKKQILIVVGIASLFTPAGPFVAFIAGVTAFREAVKWFRENAQKRDAVVDQRSFVQRTLIPGLMKAANAIASGLQSAVSVISEKLGGIIGSLAATAGNLKASIVAFLARVVEWIQTQVQALTTWVEAQLAALTTWVASGLEKLKAFLQPVLDFLGEIGAVVVDILKLPVVIAGKLWKKIPACIRDPFVNFLIEQVIKRIPLFKTVTETIPAIWAKIKDLALTVLRKVFKEGDFPGALLEILRAILNALGIPLELFTAIFAKTGTVIDLIMADPGGFLMNMFAAVKAGFVRFGENILKHLVGGLKDWLFGAFDEAGVRPPEDFTLKSVFFFIIELLGLSVELVFQRLEKKFGTEKVAPFRRAYGVLSSVFSWIGTLLEGGPDAVWKRLGEKLSGLWDAVLGAVQNWILVQVAKKAAASLAQLAAAPVGTVVKALGLVYDTIKSVVKYLKRLLEIANAVLDMATDIAHGAVEGAAALVENLLERALGVAIGFLAQYAGLGDLSTRIQDMVETIREKVIAAIDWLIEKISGAFEKLLGLVKAGVGKLVAWWKKRQTVKQGKESHTLYFEGEGSSAELTFATDPKPLADYLKEAKKDPKNKGKKPKAAIEDIEDQLKEIKSLQKKEPKDQKERDDLDLKIGNAFDVIAARLSELGAVLGTEDNPFPIPWPKPAADRYPPIYFAGKMSEPIEQGVMRFLYQLGGGRTDSREPLHKDLLKQAKEQKIKYDGPPVQRYVPTGKKDLPQSGPEIGLDTKYQLKVGSVVGPLSKATTPGGDELNDLLRPYGFGPSPEYLDADHVQEIQFGGIDDKVNMWPLNASINRGAGSTLSKMEIDTDGDGTPDTAIADLKEDTKEKYYFRIVSVDNNVPDLG